MREQLLDEGGSTARRGGDKCTRVGKVCAQVDGARSRAGERGFKELGSRRGGNTRTQARFRGVHGRPAKGEVARLRPLARAAMARTAGR